MPRNQRSGLLLILLAAAGYSFFAIFTKVIYQNGLSQPLDILVWRFALAAPIMWGVIGVQGRRTSSPTLLQIGEGSKKNTANEKWLALLGMGLLFGVVAGAAFFALERLPVSLYTVLIYTYPAIVAIMSLFMGERLTLAGWAALGLTLVGVILTVPDIFNGFGDIDPVGVVLVLTNATLYALYIVLSGRILRGHKDLTRASAWSITGSLVFSLLVLAVRGVTVPSNPGAIGGLLGLASVSTVIPIVAFYAGMHRLGAAKASILSMIEPVLTLVWAVLFLHEKLEPIQILGAALILGSVVLLQLPSRKKATDVVQGNKATETVKSESAAPTTAG